MIKEFSATNYKAFKQVSIQIKPLTILLGPNNCGKSSLMQLLLLFQQTAFEWDSFSGAPLKLNGRFVNLGTTTHLFHEGKTRKEMSVTFLLQSDKVEENSKSRLAAFERRLRSLSRKYGYLNHQFSKLISNQNHLVENMKFKHEIDHIKLLDFDSADANLYIQKLADLKKELQGGQAEFWLDEEFTAEDFVSNYEFLSGAAKFSEGTFKITFCFNCTGREKPLRLTKVALMQGDKSVLDVAFETKNDCVKSIASDYLPHLRSPSKYANAFNQALMPSKNIFARFRIANESGREITQSMLSTLEVAVNELANSLSSTALTHVSPIRSYPKRFYFSGQGDDGIFDGEPLIDLLKYNPALTKKINSWLVKFGLKVNVEALREVLHRIAIKQKNTFVDLDITDVGFGFSQVLPVIAAALLTPAHGICAIEQPEIHLHPKMQAELANLFAELVKTVHNKKSKVVPCCFMIETHSTAFLRRLRTLMVSEEDSPLAEKMSIYNIEKSDDNSSIADQTAISASGHFKWPKEFHDLELSDAIKYFSKS